MNTQKQMPRQVSFFQDGDFKIGSKAIGWYYIQLQTVVKHSS